MFANPFIFIKDYTWSTGVPSVTLIETMALSMSVAYRLLQNSLSVVSSLGSLSSPLDAATKDFGNVIPSMSMA